MQALTLKRQALGSHKVARPERREELLQRHNRHAGSGGLLARRQRHRLGAQLLRELAAQG